MNKKGNITRPGVVPKFSDLEVIALSLTAETMGIDSECYLFGKLNAICGISGVIHSYDLMQASIHDINYLNDAGQILFNCTLIGDMGYISAEIQLNLFETAHINLEVPYRSNQKNWKPFHKPFAKARKRIETVFSQFDDQFNIMRNYAKDYSGFFTRIISKVSALTVSQYLNKINNRPIGRIKYALA